MITIPNIFDSTTPYNHQPRGILSIAQTIDDGYHFIGDMLWGYDDYWKKPIVQCQKPIGNPRIMHGL